MFVFISQPKDLPLPLNKNIDVQWKKMHYDIFSINAFTKTASSSCQGLTCLEKSSSQIQMLIQLTDTLWQVSAVFVMGFPLPILTIF